MNASETQDILWATGSAAPVIGEPTVSNYEETYIDPTDFTPQQYAILAVLAVPFVLSFHPRSVLRRFLYFLPLALLLKAWLMPGRTSWDYQFGLLLTSWTLRVVDRLYLNDPEKTFLRNGIDSAKPGMGPETYDPISKFIWGLELITVTRGIGWNWQVSSIPEHKVVEKKAFLRMKLRKAVLTYLGLHVSVWTSKFLLALGESPLVETAAGPVLVPAALRDVLLSTVALHVFMYVSWAFMVYASLSLPENLFALFFVGLGVGGTWSQPEMWPSVFGPLSEGYSFRRTWGKWWHQNMRRTCGTLGAFIVRNTPALRTPSTKTAVYTRRYLQVFCVFLMSGIIHAGGSIYMATRDGTFNDGGNVSGFMYQAAIMVLEDAVCWYLGIADDGNPTMLRRCIGFAIMHGYAMYGVPQLKVMKLARDHGLDAAGGKYMIGVKMAGMGSQGIINNPFTTLIGTLNN